MMTSLRAFVLLLLGFITLSSITPLHAAPSSSEKEEGKEAAKAGEEALGCIEELIGTWTVASDAYGFRVHDQSAAMGWKLRTHMDPVDTSGFYLEVQRPRKSAGYVRPPKVEVRFNPPEVDLKTSHGKAYNAFGKELSHSYSKSFGVGTRQIWIEDEAFWYPHKDKFLISAELENARTAMAFEKAIVKGKEPVRIELYTPMYSSSAPLGHGDVLDTAGLVEAIKHAARNTYQLKKDGVECRRPEAIFVEVAAGKKDKDKGGH